jgi:hypothetical protein
MKALAITFLALLGLPILGLAGCATTKQADLDSGWGYFQQVGGYDQSTREDRADGSYVIWLGGKASVFRTGSHVKTFNFCDNSDALRLNQDSYVKLKFHWEAKYSCDQVDDIEIGVDMRLWVTNFSQRY